tara:strand:- start:950 stop:1882 length:933 start_codon:yes stop_codon:yes gene_type:complete
MRNAFSNYLTSLAKTDERIVLLMGDIGNRMFDDFKKVDPNRFINCGIAESNMMSMAAGLALNGLKPFVYTITPFVTLRCLEQIRTSVSYHDASVIIVGTGSGISYAELGPTHHSLDDIGLLNMVPNLNIFTPSDPIQVTQCIDDALDVKSPSYIRLGKKGEPLIEVVNNEINSPTSQFLNSGERSIILTYGPIVNEAITAANKLKKVNINTAVASIRRILPLDKEFYKKLILKNFVNWYIVEEHYEKGGLYSILLQWLYEENLLEKINLKSLSFKHQFIHELGKQDYIRENNHLDNKGIFEQIKNNENRN